VNAKHAALAAAKARRKRLGGFRGRAGTAADCAKARQAKSLAATARAADIAPVIDDIRTAGANSLRSIAKELNERGITAPRGGVWSGAQVRAVMARMPTRCYSLIEVFETAREGVGTRRTESGATHGCSRPERFALDLFRFSRDMARQLPKTATTELIDRHILPSIST
jgi:hypothetical protein